MARSKARAGPVGARLPCSQLRSVPTSTSRRRANFDCESPVVSLSSLIAAGSTQNTREACRSPRRISSISWTLSIRSSKNLLIVSLPGLDDLSERLAMFRRKVLSLVLREDQQHRNVGAWDEVVVDHSRPGALATTCHRNTNLSESARTFHHIADFRVLHEVALESGVAVVFKQLRDPPGERRRLNEDHALNVRH